MSLVPFQRYAYGLVLVAFTVFSLPLGAVRAQSSDCYTYTLSSVVGLELELDQELQVVPIDSQPADAELATLYYASSGLPAHVFLNNELDSVYTVGLAGAYTFDPVVSVELTVCGDLVDGPPVPAGCSVSSPVVGDASNPSGFVLGNALPAWLWRYGPGRVWVEVSGSGGFFSELDDFGGTEFVQSVAFVNVYTDVPGSRFLICSQDPMSPTSTPMPTPTPSGAACPAVGPNDDSFLVYSELQRSFPAASDLTPVGQYNVTTVTGISEPFYRMHIGIMNPGAININYQLLGYIGPVDGSIEVNQDLYFGVFAPPITYYSSVLLLTPSTEDEIVIATAGGDSVARAADVCIYLEYAPEFEPTPTATRTATPTPTAGSPTATRTPTPTPTPVPGCVDYSADGSGTLVIPSVTVNYTNQATARILAALPFPYTITIGGVVQVWSPNTTHPLPVGSAYAINAIGVPPFVMRVCINPATATGTPTRTPTRTPTMTPTATGTATATGTPTHTPTFAPTFTLLPSATLVPDCVTNPGDPLCAIISNQQTQIALQQTQQAGVPTVNPVTTRVLPTFIPTPTLIPTVGMDLVATAQAERWPFSVIPAAQTVIVLIACDLSVMTDPSSRPDGFAGGEPEFAPGEEVIGAPSMGEGWGDCPGGITFQAVGPGGTSGGDIWGTGGGTSGGSPWCAPLPKFYIPGNTSPFAPSFNTDLDFGYCQFLLMTADLRWFMRQFIGVILVIVLFRYGVATLRRVANA